MTAGQSGADILAILTITAQAGFIDHYMDPSNVSTEQLAIEY